MDTGSGHDLISRRKAQRLDLDVYDCQAITFHTANGPTVSDQGVDIDLGTLDQPAKANILEDTPSVVSVGKRCMEEGYSFIRKAKQEPYLLNKDGMRIDLVVKDYIPYIQLGDPLCEPYHMNDENSNGVSDWKSTRTVLIDSDSGDETSIDGMMEKAKNNRKRKKRTRRRKTAVPDEGERAEPAGTEVDQKEDEFARMMEEMPDPIPAGERADERREDDVEDVEEGHLGNGERRKKHKDDEEKDEDEIDVDEDGGAPNLRRRGILRMKLTSWHTF